MAKRIIKVLDVSEHAQKACTVVEIAARAADDFDTVHIFVSTTEGSRRPACRTRLSWLQLSTFRSSGPASAGITAGMRGICSTGFQMG